MAEDPFSLKDEHTLAVINRGRNGLNTWRGRVIMHEPVFLNSLRLLIEELRPQTIIEFGTYEGGLTSYLSDIGSLFVDNLSIISYDIDLLSHKLEQPIPRTELSQLDVHHIWSHVTKTHDMLCNLPHPLMVIDDVGINTLDLLRAFDPYMERNDYFIFCQTMDSDSYGSLAEWAEGKYKIDGYLCDMFGRNFIENPNGFLMKN